MSNQLNHVKPVKPCLNQLNHVKPAAKIMGIIINHHSPSPLSYLFSQAQRLTIHLPFFGLHGQEQRFPFCDFQNPRKSAVPRLGSNMAQQKQHGISPYNNPVMMGPCNLVIV